MTEGTRSQGTAQEPGSVERAVARESRRTRMLLTVFACLLAVPIAAGLLVYRVGRTDAEVVSHQVKTQVESKFAPVEQNLREARVARAEVQEVSRDLGRQRDRVEALQREQLAMKETLEKTEKLGASPAALQVEVRQLREAVRRQETAQAKMLERQQLLETNLKRLSVVRPEDVRRIQEDLVRLNRRVDALPKPPPSGGGGAPR